MKLVKAFMATALLGTSFNAGMADLAEIEKSYNENKTKIGGKIANRLQDKYNNYKAELADIQSIIKSDSIGKTDYKSKQNYANMKDPLGDLDLSKITVGELEVFFADKEFRKEELLNLIGSDAELIKAVNDVATAEQNIVDVKLLLSKNEDDLKTFSMDQLKAAIKKLTGKDTKFSKNTVMIGEIKGKIKNPNPVLITAFSEANKAYEDLRSLMKDRKAGIKIFTNADINKYKIYPNGRMTIPAARLKNIKANLATYQYKTATTEDELKKNNEFLIMRHLDQLERSIDPSNTIANIPDDKDYSVPIEFNNNQIKISQAKIDKFNSKDETVRKKVAKNYSLATSLFNTQEAKKLATDIQNSRIQYEKMKDYTRPNGAGHKDDNYRGLVKKFEKATTDQDEALLQEVIDNKAKIESVLNITLKTLSKKYKDLKQKFTKIIPPVTEELSSSDELESLAGQMTKFSSKYKAAKQKIKDLEAGNAFFFSAFGESQAKVRELEKQLLEYKKDADILLQIKELVVGNVILEGNLDPFSRS